jgi:hypothetical protein
VSVPQYEILDLVADDPSVSKTFSRQAIIAAVNAAAEVHAGRVSAAWIRPHLPGWVNPSQVGAVVSALVKTGLLTPTAEICESGNHAQRNTTRLMRVYHRAHPIPTDDKERAALAAHLGATS